MPRRVLTKESIDQLLNDHVTEVALQPTDIVTALAKEYAQERGVRLVPAAAGGDEPHQQATGQPPRAQVRSAPDPEVVRKAVIAALGHEPAGLVDVIARVMRTGPP